ncbi:hypothetical protein Psal159_03412 (plasmid) [Piscirickettsia salmonis]|nr:hypothetical protein KW89_3p29 [Piscirickettsia salmonis]APS45868.1 hypothetical protein AVI48_15660 [Piscirickettsia salmonis]APS49249.1 hypothetical protein AVI49_16465 [Piscirickettsia salmonis]QGO82364.1 hypothetical protein Psal107_03415 [Piscirickettsia salmonis]QGP24193.1 hypothetical protein Psal158_03367 [Piscirickettsia salmonis]
MLTTLSKLRNSRRQLYFLTIYFMSSLLIFALIHSICLLAQSNLSLVSLTDDQKHTVSTLITLVKIGNYGAGLTFILLFLFFAIFDFLLESKWFNKVRMRKTKYTFLVVDFFYISIIPMIVLLYLSTFFSTITDYARTYNININYHVIDLISNDCTTLIDIISPILICVLLLELLIPYFKTKVRKAL